MATTGDNLGIVIAETVGTTPWNTAFETGWGLLDAVVHLDVINRTTTTPPGSPAAGDRYLVATSPSGAWTGQAGKIAVYRSAAWVFYTPKEGWLLTSQADAGQIFKYQSGSFVLIGAKDFKDSVRVATTTNGTLATAYENGDTVDGVTLATGDRILLKNQTTGSENGIYTVNASGTPTRAKDFDETAEVTAGCIVPVTEGTANADTLYILTTNDPITIGSTSLSFSGFGPSTSATPAGSGSEIQARASASAFAAVTGSSTTTGDITLVGQAVSGGDVLLDLTPASSSGVASEVPNFVLRAATTTTNATVADYSFAKFLQPTLASNSSRTTTNAATVYIADAPAAGTNITITNPYAIWVDNGNVRFDGFLGVGTTAPATTQFYVKGQSSGNVTARIDAASGATADVLEVQRNGTNQFVVDNTGKIAHTPEATTSSTTRFKITTAADTGLSTGTEVSYGIFGGDASGNTVSRQWNTASLSLQREWRFPSPTIAFAGASTASDVITVDIETPTAGTNATITRATGLRIKGTNNADHLAWFDHKTSSTGDVLALGLVGTKVVRFISNNGTINNVLAANGALASNATDGFTWLGEYSGTGAPTGTPTSYTGAEPIVMQRDNVNAVYTLWAYSNSGWRDIGGQFKRYDTSSGSGAQTIDFNSSTAANVTRQFTATGNATLTFSNPPPAGSLVTVVIIQDGTGSRTITWPASVKWSGGTAPTLTTTANKRDLFHFMWDGSNYYLVSQTLNL